MKVFIAESIEKGASKPNENGKIMNYHWCDDGDLLMFGLFQSDTGNPDAISMCGIAGRKFTTNITVKDINISLDFYKEMITDSIAKSMKCDIDKDGNLDVEVWADFKFNINDIVNELINKASKFEEGQSLRCVGRDLVPVGTSAYEVLGNIDGKPYTLGLFLSKELSDKFKNNDAGNRTERAITLV